MICAACGVLIAVIIGVIVFFATQKEPQKQLPQTGDDNGEPWFVPRSVWNAWPARDVTHVNDSQEFVVIIHTASGFCRFMEYCSQEVLNIQIDHITSPNKNYSDIAYNFVVGGDGRVYEGQGWKVRGAHTAPLNSRALGVAFIGDYRSHYQNSSLTPRMIANTHRLLSEGVENGGLRKDYKLVPHCQVTPTESPGDNVYNVIKKWDHFSTFTLDQHVCTWPEVNFTGTVSGDYRSHYQNSSLTPRMIANTQRLLSEGVENGGLRKDYKLVPHCQVKATASPGDNVYNVIKKWDHFSTFTLDHHFCTWPEANFIGTASGSGSHTILPPVSVLLLVLTTLLKLGMY